MTVIQTAQIFAQPSRRCEVSDTHELDLRCMEDFSWNSFYPCRQREPHCMGFHGHYSHSETFAGDEPACQSSADAGSDGAGQRERGRCLAEGGRGEGAKNQHF